MHARQGSSSVSVCADDVSTYTASFAKRSLLNEASRERARDEPSLPFFGIFLSCDTYGAGAPGDESAVALKNKQINVIARERNDHRRVVDLCPTAPFFRTYRVSRC